MRVQQLRRGKVAALVGALSLGAALAAVPAWATGPGLPPSYQVQTIDTTLPATSGGFGNPLVSIGDVNRDGESDTVSLQTTGSPLNDGVIFVHSGETGQLIDQVNAPDPGGIGDRSVVDRVVVDRLNDIGSCPAPPPASDPDQTCNSPVVGPRDGANEILVGAMGVDVEGVRDVGRVWVFDGATLAVLKRIDMPPADRALQAARQAENPALTLRAGGFGRTAISPRGLPPCEGNGGVGPCDTSIPASVRTGDLDGGGQPDVVIGANRFNETGATAHPGSHCARTSAPLCQEAGRAYVYRGEDIAGSDPNVILDGARAGQTPARIIKNPVAQGDAGRPAGSFNENFGHAQMVVGDVGSCRTGGGFPAVGPGDICSAAASTNVPDGRPELVIAAHRADFPFDNLDATALVEAGASFLFDGATGAVLHRYEPSEPQAGALFGYTTKQMFALGNLQSGTGAGAGLPDLVMPAMVQNAQSLTGTGKAYVVNGDFKAGAGLFLGQLNDPTPLAGGQFAVPTEAVGDLVPGNVGNELLAGSFGDNTDVHFFNASSGQVLQTITDPDPPQMGPSGGGGSRFGYQVAPLGDLNEDGYLDFAVGAPRWDSPDVGDVRGTVDQGRIHIFRSQAPPRAQLLAPISGPAPVTPAASTSCPAGTSAGVTCQTSGSGLTMTGTAGVDRFVGSSGRDTINCGGGNDVVLAGAGNDVVRCGAGNDTINGGAGNDSLGGEAGNDRVSGGAGNDSVSGGAGNDKLAGNAGNDSLSGGAGNDSLAAGAGTDRLTGGAGNDSLNTRDRKRGDTANCGESSGDRDVATVDSGDRVSGCERVRR